MNKGAKKLIAILALTGMLSTNISSMSTFSVQADEKGNIEKILLSLSDEEKQALDFIEASEENTGLLLNDNVNLDSDEDLTVIVEFNQKPAEISILEGKIQGKMLALQDEEEKVEDAHEKMTKHIQNMFKIKTYSGASNYIEYSYKKVFNGMAVKVPANRVEELLECDVVKAIYSEEVIEIDPILEVNETESDVNLRSVDSDEIGVEKLHSEGISGEGIKVGVLDTGIDYNHPDLKAVYRGGYDYVDKDNDPMETTYDDWLASGQPEVNSNGNKYYTNHGTHVSGIIAGQGTNESDYAKEGVAPDSELYVYRVLGKYGSGYSTDIIAAIEQSVIDEMDVINLSLGASTNNPLYPTGIAVNNAVLSGVVAVVSAGNSGPNTYTLGSPGASALSLTVGASDIPMDILTSVANIVNANGESYDLRLVGKHIKENPEDLGGQELSIEYVGNGGPIGYEGKDVNGKVVIADRGVYALTDITAIARANGAVAVLLVNNTIGHVSNYVGEDKGFVPMFSITQENGIALKALLESNKEIKISFDSFAIDKTEGDKLASFSSRGPVTKTHDIKPEIVAPGVSISSTVPSYMAGPESIGNYEFAYSKLNGTSMSAPFAAGVAALMLQENKDLTPMELKTKMMNTADPMNGDYSVYEIGPGRVNAYDAVKTEMNITISDVVTVDNGENGDIEIQDGDLNFGVLTDVGNNIVKEKVINIDNSGSEAKNFKVEVIQNKNVGLAKDWESNGVSLSHEQTISVDANSVLDLNVAINIPSEAELGVYEGWIVLVNEANGEEDYRIPFAATKSEKITNKMYMDLDKIATPIGYYSRYIVGASSIFFSLVDPVKAMTFTIVDGNTGEEFGYFGSLNTNGISPGLLYRVDGFNGMYLPITDDENNPIAYEAEKLNTGNYKLRLRTLTTKGEILETDFAFYVDNKLPEVKELSIDTENGPLDLTGVDIYEYDPVSEKTIPVSAKFYDEDLNKILEANIDPFSRPSFTNYYGIQVTGSTAKVTAERDGTVTGTLAPSPMKNITATEIQAVDATGNTSINDVRTVYFVKKGTKYVSLKPQKKTYKDNETPTIDLTVNNATDVKEVNFEYRLKNHLAELVEFNLLPEYQDKATLTYTTDVDDDNMLNIKGKIVFNEALTTVDGGAKVAQFTLKNKVDFWYNSTISITGTSKYTNSNGETVKVDTASPSYRREPESIKVRMEPYWAEGLTFEVSGIIRPTLGDSFDYSTVGLETHAVDRDGNKFETFYDTQAKRYVFTAPLENKKYDVTYNLPGHFTVYRELTIDRVDQLGIGYYQEMSFERAIAGDVNKDEVIDINDAIAIKDNYLSNLRAADINFDGVVDMNDLQYVIDNFGIKNPTATETPEPVLEKDGVTIESIKSELENGVTIVANKASNIKANASNTSVSLTWDAPVSGVGVTGYTIYKDGKEVETVKAGTTNYIVENLKANTIYGFKVVVKYSDGTVSKPISTNIRTNK
ncbi:S8 family serine peptidase [Clostridium sp.]|uniref:S8 family serine peptidase n=1 Tax=Clostridium sp. TaxID=1506 RepID=UPI003F408B88